MSRYSNWRETCVDGGDGIWRKVSMSAQLGGVWVCLGVRTALLLGVLEERVHIVADDDTGLAAEDVFGTHCVGSVRIGEVWRVGFGIG